MCLDVLAKFEVDSDIGYVIKRQTIRTKKIYAQFKGNKTKALPMNKWINAGDYFPVKSYSYILDPLINVWNPRSNYYADPYLTAWHSFPRLDLLYARFRFLHVRLHRGSQSSGSILQR